MSDLSIDCSTYHTNRSTPLDKQQTPTKAIATNLLTQFPLLLIFQLSHQLRMLPDGPLVLVVLVVGVRWRWRVGHIGLGRVQRVGTPSCPRSGTSCCGHCCCSSGTHRTGHNGRLVEMRRSGTRPGLITGCQGVEERRCRAIYLEKQSK